MNWFDTAFNVSLGSSILFTSIGLLKYVSTNESLDNCSRRNINLGLSSSAFLGLLQLYSVVRK